MTTTAKKLFVLRAAAVAAASVFVMGANAQGVPESNVITVQAPTTAVAAPAPSGTEDRTTGEAVKTLDRIVAVVNNDVITEAELQDRVHDAAINLRRQNIELPPMEQLRNQVLDRMITERAILQHAAEVGIRVDQQMVSASIDQIARNNKLTTDELRQRLQADGVSFESFRRQIHDEIVTQRLREQEVDSKIDIPESEVDAYLAEKAGFTGSNTTEFHVQHILLPYNDNDRSSASAAEGLAEDLVARAQKGEDFGKLAATYSKADDAMSGGDLGWRDSSRMPSIFWQAINGQAKTGFVTAVKSDGAWHVIKVEGVRDGVQAKLAGQPVEQVHIRDIVLFVSNMSSEGEVVSRLQDIRHKIEEKQGDFATYARLYSVDKSATRGGDMGWMQPGDLPPEIDSVVKNLQPGQVSEPIRTSYGYHLIQVVERRTQAADPKRSRLAARSALREKKLAEAVFNWQREMRDKAFVDIRHENL